MGGGTATPLAELKALVPWVGLRPAPQSLTAIQQRLNAITASPTLPSLHQLWTHTRALQLAVEAELHRADVPDTDEVRSDVWVASRPSSISPPSGIAS